MNWTSCRRSQRQSCRRNKKRFLTPADFFRKVLPHSMRNRGSVRSFIESHRAEATRPDRGNFLPQTGQLPSALRFSGRLPQLGSSVLKASLSVPNEPPPVPIFLASLPCERPRPHWSQGRPQRTGGRPQFFCGFPHCTEGFPQRTGHVPQFSSRRPHLQWSLPQQFMRDCRKRTQKTGEFWTAVAERSGDTAFRASHPVQSGVALRFPPHSKAAANFRFSSPQFKTKYKHRP